MSGVQLASSFGDPNAQPPPPPTPPPTKTPTSTIFPSPACETPKQYQGQFDDSSGWTPRFAEEYSVFNATPGNIRGSPQDAAFAGHFAPFTPFHQPPPSAGQKRRLSAEDIAEDIATHATHFSSNPNLPLPPVEPSRRLPSSPGALVLTHAQPQPAGRIVENDQQGHPFQPSRPSKKPRRGLSGALDIQSQTATPPPSSRKGERKLAPKTGPDAMQNDQEFGEFAGGAAHQVNGLGLVGFVNSPSDIFANFPISAPASAPVFTDARVFWGSADPAGMAGMDIDFSASTELFQAAAPGMGHHRPAGSLDWGRANQMFQETGILPQQQQQQQPQPQQQMPQQQPQQVQGAALTPKSSQPPAKRERPLAPKAAVPALDTTTLDQSVLDGTLYHTPIDDPFTLVHPGSGVDPGLLFSRPPSSSMEASATNPSLQPPSSSAPAASQTVQDHSQQGNTAQIGLGISKAPMRAELRRSLSVKELGPSKQVTKGTSASSPVKAGGRPGLSRSFSESRGKRSMGRPLAIASSASSTLPVLAPAVKPMLQPNSLATSFAAGDSGMNANRPSSHGSRSSRGRSSPPKAYHHHRLSSLTVIPEVRPGGMVKIIIDANGRAHAETVVSAIKDNPPSPHRRRSTQQSSNNPNTRWDSTDEEREGDAEDDDESSTDDELIIIPSRNTSFALPDPLMVSGSRARYHHTSHRSLSEHSTTSSSVMAGDPQSMEVLDSSEAETVMDASPSGNAAIEVEKLRRSRQAQGHGRENRKPGLFLTKGAAGIPLDGFGGRLPLYHQQHRSSSAISPTTLTDASLPTPSVDGRSNGMRCVCSSPDTVDNGDFMVQCEACEMWLHGKCINILKRSMMPSVYICAFCVSTPPSRVRRASSALSPSLQASSPSTNLLPARSRQARSRLSPTLPVMKMGKRKNNEARRAWEGQDLFPSLLQG